MPMRRVSGLAGGHLYSSVWWVADTQPDTKDTSMTNDIIDLRELVEKTPDADSAT